MSRDCFKVIYLLGLRIRRNQTIDNGALTALRGCTYDVNKDIFFYLGDSGRRGRDQKNCLKRDLDLM